MIRIPTPQELLKMFQKIDPSLFMVTIPNLGVVSYGSELHNFGFVVGIDPETGFLTAIVGNQNIYIPNEESTYMSLDEVMSWFRERFDIWKEIPVEGRTVSNAEAAATLEAAIKDGESGEDDMELTPLVKDIVAGRVANEVALPVAA